MRALFGKLSALTRKIYTSINIVGGGSKDGYLNELTARTKVFRCVSPGPRRGRRWENLMAQFLAAGEFDDLDGRQGGDPTKL